jgi:hypothetical protein
MEVFQVFEIVSFSELDKRTMITPQLIGEYNPAVDVEIPELNGTGKREYFAMSAP